MSNEELPIANYKLQITSYEGAGNVMPAPAFRLPPWSPSPVLGMAPGAACPSYIKRRGRPLDRGSWSDRAIVWMGDLALADKPPVAPVRCTVKGREDGFIQITVPDDVEPTQVDAVVASHVADPNYGLTPPITEEDLMSMSDRDLRRFLVQRLLGGG